ncbi:pilus assembly protein TadG-related protein [Streptomyces coeruleorubidus]|uniref:pilus assembly protein TadG-related protein n=1 Tax=Streptomyces coeruleorubidus TaxID=116188 RepID=UPI00379C8AE6
MRPRRYGDAGQAFPIYITVVGSLLFLAFAYFAVGQAAVNRNGAQTAADAAALAAAQDRRDLLAGAWVNAVLDPTKWQDIFDGNAEGLGKSCWRAHQLAAQNDARVIGCESESLLGFTIEVETNKPVGDSVVPGTADNKANASATAVIEPRCTFKLPAADAGKNVLPRLSCKDNRDWDLKPGDPPEVLPKPEDLFDVHLAD